MEETLYFAHPSAVIDSPTDIGKGCRIWHFCHIMKDVHLGRNCVLGQNCFVASGVTIGDDCHLQNNVSVYYGVTLEDNVFVGPSAVFTNDLNPRPFHHKSPDDYPRTLVRSGASIGANATVVAGVTIGEHAFLGAGSVLVRDLPAHGIAVGVPAQLIGYMCLCGEKLPLKPFHAKLTGRELLGEATDTIKPPAEAEFECPKCRRGYVIVKGKIAQKRADSKYFP
jgi:UDP-2-acetamido-3-amino-2,3-dideoxy-glucuronate N-acetyltransferase